MKTQERQCTLSNIRTIGILNFVFRKRGVIPSLVAMSLSSPSRTGSRAWKREQRVGKFKFLGNINNLRLNVEEIPRILAAAIRMLVNCEGACDAYPNSGTDKFEEFGAKSLVWAVPCIALPCVGKNVGGIQSEEQLIRCMEEELDPATLRDKSILVWNDDEPLMSETDNSGAASQNGAIHACLISQSDDLPEREVEDISSQITDLFSETDSRSKLTDLEVEEHDDAQMICGDPIKVSAEESSLTKTELQEINKWDMFPEIVQDMVLSYLPAKDLFRASLVCQKFRNLLRRSRRRELFEETRANLVHTEGVYSPLYFTTDEVGWHWGGLDVAEKKWSTLPSLRCLPAPDPELFKDFLVAGCGGLLCVNVEKSPKDEKLIMCNPMKQQTRELPPLNWRRHPVLMHVLVDKVKNSYKVIVAGSSTIGTEDRSLKTEVYDSTTGEWRVTGNLPLPAFGLNEYQNGAYYEDEIGKGWLFCVAVLEEGGKGVIAYDIEEGEWLSNWKLPIPPVNCQACFATTQMIECKGQVYLFSEQESGKDVWFCIHRLKVNAAMGWGAWENLMMTKRKGNRGLLVYPEFICVPSGKDELCIFNTVEYTMETCNVDRMLDSPVVQNAPAPVLRGKSFHSLNPLGFKFEPNFWAKV